MIEGAGLARRLFPDNFANVRNAGGFRRCRVAVASFGFQPCPKRFCVQVIQTVYEPSHVALFTEVCGKLFN